MADVRAKERRILVAVDEGEESSYALTWCLKNLITQNFNDTLILLYAKQSPRVVYTAMDGTGYLFSSDIFINTTIEKYNNNLADRVIKNTETMCKEHLQNSNVKLEARVVNGDPRDVICEMVEKLGVDVLVMGSHGYGWIKRALLGSVSNHCVQNVKCTVLIAKKPNSNIGSK